MNAVWKPSITIITATAPKVTFAEVLKLFSRLSAIILFSFLVLVDFSPAASAQNSSLHKAEQKNAVSQSTQMNAVSQPTQKDTGPSPANPCAIWVNSPKAGDSFKVGSSKIIEWHHSGLSGTIKIFLYKGGVPTSGTPLSSLTLDNSGKGTFNWAINPNLIPGNYYTIVIESNNKQGLKGVSGPFSLTGAAPTQPSGSASPPSK